MLSNSDKIISTIRINIYANLAFNLGVNASDNISTILTHDFISVLK